MSHNFFSYRLSYSTSKLPPLSSFHIIKVNEVTSFYIFLLIETDTVLSKVSTHYVIALNFLHKCFVISTTLLIVFLYVTAVQTQRRHIHVNTPGVMVSAQF